MERLPDLIQTLQGRDLGFLRIVAELWGFELEATEARLGLQRLARRQLDDQAVGEMFEMLPLEARLALEALQRGEGRMPWAFFTRRYGTVREMGAARRDRERPFDNANASAAEALWYRGLIGRAFFDTPDGPEEFAYIPGDLIDLLPTVDRQAYTPLGRPATPAERSFLIPAGDWILDDACTLLAALRLGLSLEQIRELLLCGKITPYPVTPQALQALLEAAGLLDTRRLPLPEQTRAFLEASRGEALLQLERGWLRSANFNELHLMPGLSVEGEWQNDPLRARRAVLDFLSTIPGNLALRGDPAERPYWSLNTFVSAVRQNDPDFQRPAGDYDSWYLREQTSGEYLRGFEHWEAVDGALLRFMIAGPLHWLGLLDLASPAAPEAGQSATITAFRFSEWASDLLSLKTPQILEKENSVLIVAQDGRLRGPRMVPRSVRYQVSRFCAWEGLVQDDYLYRLTPSSLERARRQGLGVHHLLALLRRQAKTVPPALVKALEGWEAYGSPARLERLNVLRVKHPEILQALLSSRAARFLGEVLGPEVVVVKPGAAEKVLAALAELGYLGEIEDHP